MSKRIHELAIPKGTAIPLCELCGKKSTTKCQTCKLTHYCSEYHKTIDQKSFHHSACGIIAYIRKEHPLPFTEEDRKEAEDILLKKKQEVQKLAEIATRKWLMEENAELAYPAAMSALNFAKDLSPINSIEILYPTSLVSETYLRLGDIKVAQEYMVLASWVSQNYDKIPPIICARLQRLVGLVCMNIGKWQQAREAFAESVYATAVEYGTDDIHMAVAYGYLGLSLLKFDGDEIQNGATASFHKMADLWMRYLLNQYDLKFFRCATEEEMKANENVRELESQYMESKIVFRLLYEGIRRLGMNQTTDLINFKILCIQALQQIRDGRPHGAAVYKQEALATATRTRQHKAVPKSNLPVLIDMLGADYLMLWDEKNNRPRTAATKYLEMIKNLQI